MQPSLAGPDRSEVRPSGRKQGAPGVAAEVLHTEHLVVGGQEHPPAEAPPARASRQQGMSLVTHAQAAALRSCISTASTADSDLHSLEVPQPLGLC